MESHYLQGIQRSNQQSAHLRTCCYKEFHYCLDPICLGVCRQGAQCAASVRLPPKYVQSKCLSRLTIYAFAAKALGLVPVPRQSQFQLAIVAPGEPHQYAGLAAPGPAP